MERDPADPSGGAAYPALELYINGRWTNGSSAAEVEVLNPATDTALGVLPLASGQDVRAAVDAAAAAEHRWRDTPAIERSRIIRHAATWLRAHSDHVAQLVTVELGKPLREARDEVVVAAEHLEWAAEEGRRSYGRQIPGRNVATVQWARPEPLGPVAGLASWNAPLITPARKIGYALAAGCTMVLKPSEETPASALALVRAFEAAALPAGVLNVVFGTPDVFAPGLFEDRRIKAVTFTGSTRVGAAIARVAAPLMKRLVLELGGHAPVIVTASVPVADVARAAARAKYRNSGQVCTSPSRFFVHRSVHEEFVAAFVSAAAELKVGDGLDPETDMGPLANHTRVAAMRAVVDDARTRGLDVHTGDEPLPAVGSFWPPTVIVDASTDSIVAREEPFGPVAATFPYSDLSDAIGAANGLDVGLASYVWSTEANIVERCVRELRAGSVAVNTWKASWPETPFGGCDDSGVGTEGGVEGLAAFQRLKYSSYQPL